MMEENSVIEDNQQNVDALIHDSVNNTLMDFQIHTEKYHNIKTSVICAKVKHEPEEEDRVDIGNAVSYGDIEICEAVNIKVECERVNSVTEEKRDNADQTGSAGGNRGPTSSISLTPLEERVLGLVGIPECLDGTHETYETPILPLSCSPQNNVPIEVSETPSTSGQHELLDNDRNGSVSRTPVRAPEPTRSPNTQRSPRRRPHTLRAIPRPRRIPRVPSGGLPRRVAATRQTRFGRTLEFVREIELQRLELDRRREENRRNKVLRELALESMKLDILEKFVAMCERGFTFNKQR